MLTNTSVGTQIRFVAGLAPTASEISVSKWIFSSIAAAWMFRLVTSSRATRSGPTVLTIVASTSAVAATVVMFSGVFGLFPKPCASASPDARPIRPMPPITAPAPLIICRRVCADSSPFSSSIARLTKLNASDIRVPPVEVAGNNCAAALAPDASSAHRDSPRSST